MTNKKIDSAAGKDAYLSDRTVYHKLCVVLGIVQREIIAREASCSGDQLFGYMSMEATVLEEAAHLLTEVIPEVENA